MSLIIDADGEYLSGSGVTLLPSGCTEATFAIWVKRASASSTYQSYAYAGRTAAEAYGSFWVAHNGDGPDCFAVPAGLQSRAASTAGANSTSWQVLVFTYKNGVATKTYAGIVGGSLVSFTGETGYAAYNHDVDNIRIGLGEQTASGWYPRARLAHCALWDKALTATEAGELFNGGTAGAGKNPQAVANANLKFYAPLTSDATVTVSGISLSATGTLTYDAGDNPNVEAYGGATPTLVIADSSHGHIADALVLTSQHSIVVAEAAHGHTADNLTLSVLGTLAIDDAFHAHLADSITLTTTTPGTITIPAVKDWGTGNLKLGETGVQVDIRNKSTGALVVRKTGQTTHGTTGVCVVTDALIVIGIEYEVATRFSDGSMGMWDYTAA